ncbi:MAG TPA: Uma2 family endonuclease [Fimbriiglobus sp.]|nr:Uma2 family endonuclease [Fimbriiglobus sp.]
MTPTTHTPSTLDDLMKVNGKAELIGGRIVPIMPSGFWPGKVSRRITRSLEDYVAAGGQGEPVEDNIGYAFDSPLPSGRQSFSPDSSLYLGPVPKKWMRFIDGFPAFAAEVRSENDYGPAKDGEYADKRKDYFFAGTLAVWDVDPIGETVTLYRASDPIIPTVFRPGDTADAEPAVPGWRLKVGDLFA